MAGALAEPQFGCQTMGRQPRSMAGGDDPVCGAVQQEDRSADGARITAPRKGVRDVVVDLAVRAGGKSRLADRSQPSPRPLEQGQIGRRELSVVAEP